MKHRNWFRCLAAGCGLALLMGIAMPAACAAEEEAAPTVIWLDFGHVGYDMGAVCEVGDGLVVAEKIQDWERQPWNSDAIVENMLISLTGEVIKTPFEYNISQRGDYPHGLAHLWPETARFHRGYLSVLRHDYEKEPYTWYGLMDTSGEVVVPMEFATEEEAWAQVGMEKPDVPDSKALYVRTRRDDPQGNALYGYARLNEDGSEGELAVDCRFAWSNNAHYIYDSDRYVLVQEGEGADRRYGLLKNPAYEETVSDWAREEVDAALAQGLTPGCCAGYYQLEMTRSQAAALLVQTAETITETALPTPEETPFDDADALWVRKAYAAGIVNGMGDGRFCPDRVITWEELAAMVNRTAALLQVPEEHAEAQAGVPDDVSDWAGEDVAALLNGGLMEHIALTGPFRARGCCSVEQAIVIAYRLAERAPTEP